MEGFDPGNRPRDLEPNQYYAVKKVGAVSSPLNKGGFHFPNDAS